MFDIQLAIAKLDFADDDAPDLSVLRHRYPDIGFVFDRIDALQGQVDAAEREHRNIISDTEYTLNEQIYELEARVDALRTVLIDAAEYINDADVLLTISGVL